MKKSSRVLCLSLCACLLQARHQQQSCGTHSLRSGEEWQLHQESHRTAAKRGKAFATASAPRPDLGNIALLDDADGVVARRNRFNLDKQTLRFVPTANAKYRYELGPDTYDSSLVETSPIVEDLRDDDSREFPLAFAFPFYGVAYRSIFVNSDGNLTFVSNDQASTDRSLGRLIAGQPRIAALFTDLDPTQAISGVRVLAEAHRFVVTWSSVPTYVDRGKGSPQTFQLRIFPNGRIEFAYSGITIDDAVVGITPGKFQGAPTLVSFVKDPSAEYGSTIAERFSASERLDIFTASQKFYQSHDDAYDYLVFYNTLNIEADEDTVALEVSVRTSRQGIGDPPVDLGFESGSKRRLQALLNMGQITQYPRDPAGRLMIARIATGDTPVTVLAHEAGHLFLAYVSVKDELGGRPMLGHQGAHWAFNFNSEASVMEGNRIQDNGASAVRRFLTTATVEQYSPLDQYLMGFRPPQDVPDMFYVANPRGITLPALPRIGVSFDGERRDVTIDDIVREEGRRTPDSTVG